MTTATFASETAKRGRALLEEVRGQSWPNPYWGRHPEEFATRILGVEPWGYQTDVMLSVRDFRHTAVAGGRKIGKDWIAAVIALWWYASYEDARVFCYGPTMKQIAEILWRQIRFLWAAHGRCVSCKKANPEGPRPCAHSAIMTGKMGLNASTGLRAPDGRQIIGMTAVSDGGVIGFSGRMLAIEDEASRMKDSIDEAIVGNLAGEWTRRLAISNPTKTRGFFYDLFHKNRPICGANSDGKLEPNSPKSGLFQVSSETSPNIALRKLVHKDLASLEWLAERELAWGRGSAPWLWHVEGKFLTAEAGQLFSTDDITEAELRWEETELYPEYAEAKQDGRLHLGVDIAGEGYTGDESAFAARRANRCLALDTRRGLSPDDHVQAILDYLRPWRRPFDSGDDNIPIVTIDADGETGWRVFKRVKAWADDHERDFKAVPFHGSHKPKGVLGEQYKLNRDLLFGGLVDWMKTGAIPQSLQLEAELVILRWTDVEGNKRTLVHKSVLREELQGKSTDRADALALSTWGARAEMSGLVSARSFASSLIQTTPDRGRPPEGAPRFLADLYGGQRKRRR